MVQSYPRHSRDIRALNSGPYPVAARWGSTGLSGTVQAITQTADYQAGRTLVFVTFDEGQAGTTGENCADPSNTDTSCHVATIAVAASVHPSPTPPSTPTIRCFAPAKKRSASPASSATPPPPTTCAPAWASKPEEGRRARSARRTRPPPWASGRRTWQNPRPGRSQRRRAGRAPSLGADRPAEGRRRGRP
jgi:hypothetical protein